MNHWKHWTSLWQPCWKGLAELFNKNYIKNWKNLGYYTSFTENILPQNDPLDAKDAILTRRLMSFARIKKFLLLKRKSISNVLIPKKIFFLKTFLGEDKSSFLQPFTFYHQAAKKIYPISYSKLILRTEAFFKRKLFRNIFLMTLREQLRQPCRTVSDKNINIFSQNHKNVTKIQIFHNICFCSKWSCLHVKPRSGKLVKSFCWNANFFAYKKKKKTFFFCH